MDQTVWIIDGNNVIHRDRELREVLRGRGPEIAAKRLEVELSEFKRRLGRNASVVLVFDGVAAPGERTRQAKGFRVLRPSSGQDADAIVLEEARRLEGRFEVNVVTSDRADIGNRLRGLRVEWHSVEEFVGQLRKRRRRSGDPRREIEAATDKPEAPRGKEVDRWLEIFGEGDGSESARDDDEQ